MKLKHPGLVTLALVSPLTTALADTKPASEICGEACTRRLMYEFAYASAAAGVGSAMDTYDSVGWCSAPEQKGWCPDLIRQQISDIAAEVIKDVTIYKIDEEMYKIDEKPYLVREMSKASGRAAVLAMSWATIAMTGGKTLGQNASDHLAWSLDHLDNLNRGHTRVDSDKLRKAMKAHTPGTPAEGSRVEWPYYVEGVMTPSYMLGPLMGSPGPCLDPFLCSPATYAAINPLLVGMMSEGVLPKEDWLLFLLESASHKGLVKRGGKGKGPAEGGQWSSQYGKWLDRPGYSGEGHQVPPNGFETSKPYTDDAAKSPADFDSNDLVRAEEYHHETNTMQNRVLRPDPPARESVTTSPETQTFREVGTDGKPIGPSKTLNKGSVKKLIQQFEDLGKGNDLKLLTKDGNALKNSLGDPLIGKATKEGNVVELETLEPIGQTIRTDTGNMVRKFSMYDRDGRHTKTNVWEDDVAESLKNFIRLTEGVKSPWPTIEELPEGNPNTSDPAPDEPQVNNPNTNGPPPQPIEDPSPSDSGNSHPDDSSSHNSENPPSTPDDLLPANSPKPRPRPPPGDPFSPYLEPEEFQPPPSEGEPPGSESSGYDAGSESSSIPPNPDRIPPSPPESIPPSLPPSEPPSEPMTNPPAGPGVLPPPLPVPIILPLGDSHTSSSSSTSSTSPSSMATTGSQVKTVSSATTTGESSAHSSTLSTSTATTTSEDKAVSSTTTTGTSSAHSTSASSQSTSAVSTATPTSVVSSEISVEVVTETSSVRPVSTVVTISTVRPVTASLFRPTFGPYSNGTAVVLTKTWASTGVMTFQTVTRSAAVSAA
ncbi:hypothetical protein LTR56_001152 [Elasticomyces elasticus]|nr:hypothetical protein LTR56_001152 [Elasticomyces elasticus]KAK3663552.1 hypothetical protein LTR22_005724 [Elasticomyces elasticus]KAK4927061.1 hypothetical protein LTR49_005976 [Elasticomyces elasticus]KAK5769073.1 hypothetical protein LTS12_000787 [Elasticomyces elasticus]